MGFSHYASYLWPGMTSLRQKLLAAGVGAVALLLLYRRITFLGKVTVTLWLGTVLTMGSILVLGLPHFDPKLAFSSPPWAFDFSKGFFLGARQRDADCDVRLPGLLRCLLHRR